jgi:hypothetical protein
MGYQQRTSLLASNSYTFSGLNALLYQVIELYGDILVLYGHHESIALVFKFLRRGPY